ncbi:MAG: ribonuclease J [Candidatus Rokuibacteriota bacterium]|nr:MAG: ribonuclease J [Candidatus Rokubacteria bacterium]
MTQSAGDPAGVALPEPPLDPPIEPAVRIVPLGGLGEIGLNMMVLEAGDDLLAVDCGLMFPDDEMPGIDYVIPDFSYLLAKREQVRGVILTHAHEDHIGALPYLLRVLDVPVYGPRMALALAGERLREHGLLERARLHPVEPRRAFELGAFHVEPIRVTHSVVDGLGYGIGTPVGTLVHTGDFKLDASPIDGERSDYHRLAELGERGVLCLMSDSTNVDRPGTTPSEREVGRALAERFRGAPGRIILATFASHIHRIQQVLDLADRFGRKVALLGRSMETNVRLASELGYLRVPEGCVVPLEALAGLPRYRQVILSTGSQGEPNSALALMAAEEHKDVQVAEGDLAILSARVIPGHERTITRVVNQLLRLGAEVLWEPVAFVHVSGHASQDELRLMLNLVRPSFFVPIHGEYRHLLAHGRLARDVGLPDERVLVIEDGQGVELTKTTARVLQRFPVGRVLVDGKGIGDVGTVVLRDRQLLAQDGMVVVVVTVDRGTGEIVAGPEIASRGWVYERESEGVLEEAKTVLREALAARTGEEPLAREVLVSLLRGTLRRFINQRYERKPIVLPMVLEA